jgi:hypothetical protein
MRLCPGRLDRQISLAWVKMLSWYGEYRLKNPGICHTASPDVVFAYRRRKRSGKLRERMDCPDVRSMERDASSIRIKHAVFAD